MGKLKPLIKNQRIRIDNHKRGIPIKWGDGLHIHKSFFQGKYNSIEILIPIDSDQEIRIRKNKNKDINQLGEIISEIKKALKPDSSREEFVRNIIEDIMRFGSNNISLEEVRQSAQRIAKHFDLDQKIVFEIISYYNEKINSYTSYHADLESKNMQYYEIDQRKDSISIKPSSNKKTIRFKPKLILL
jgi:hypothetical protein